MTDDPTNCPVCEHDKFELHRIESDDEPPTFAINCGRCGLRIAEAVTTTLDVGLRDDIPDKSLEAYR